MPVVDIANETRKVGAALTSVRVDQMILSLAKGIAWGQYDLDKVGVDITKMMGVPGTVNIGGEQLSMLEAGFLPSFYHFVDTILEIKMEVNIREEQTTQLSFNETMSRTVETETGAELGYKASGSAAIGPFSASAEISAKAHWKSKSSSAYSRTVDAKHSQSFSQDLSASSLIRTKIVPVPPPELLVERVKILLERLREDAEVDEAEQGFWFETELAEGYSDALDSSSVPEGLRPFFEENGRILALNAKATVVDAGESWQVEDRAVRFPLRKRGARLRVYQEVAEEEKKGLDEILMGKVEDQLLEREQKLAERIEG